MQDEHTRSLTVDKSVKSPESVALRLLLRQRHWQPHRTFLAEYDKAAAKIDKKLVGHGPSRVQLHR